MKKIFLSIICLIFIFLPTFSINSQIKVYDNENIYVLCDGYGKVLDKILVDWIRVKGDGSYEVKDPYKNLEEIRKIYGDGEVEFKDDFVLIKGESKDYQDTYYRGNYKGDLPFDIKVKYFLNGVEKTVDEIRGKTGTVKILVSGESKYKIDGEIVPLLLVLSTSLDSTKIKDLNLSQDSKPQVFGKKYQVNLMTILDPNGELYLEYTEDSLEIPEIMISISPNYISFDLPDTSFLGNFLEGVDNISKLVEFQKIYIEELKNSLSKTSSIDFSQIEKGIEDLKLIGDVIKVHGNILLKISESIDIDKLNSLKMLPQGFENIIISLKEINKNLNSILFLIDGYINLVEKIKKINEENQKIILNLKDDLKYKLIENLKVEESLINILLNGGSLPDGTNLISLKDLKLSIQKIIDGNNLIISNLENLQILSGNLTILIDSNIKLKNTLNSIVNGGEIEGQTVPGLNNVSNMLKGGLDKMKIFIENFGLQIKNSFNEIIKALDTLLIGGKVIDKSFYGLNKTVDGLKLIKEGIKRAKGEFDKTKENIDKKKILVQRFDSFIGKPNGSEGRVQFIVKISP
ncbi:MAG: hypothetical protein ACPLN1_00775 [Caldisericia bacterium]